MKRLSTNQWRAIRQAWEFCPDELSYTEAANRASEKHGFKAPSKVAVHKRVVAEKWERRGSLAGINAAAHRIADRIGSEAEYKPGIRGGGAAYNEPGARPDGLAAEYEERGAAELRRAEIRARHRKEWEQIVVLRQEALKHRNDDLDQTFHLLKITKIAAESTAIQQNGECRSWGLDELVDAGRLKSLSDQQLEALVVGKRLS